ncbi:hypothetical protein [Corynebacterium sp.]|uniref:hypothetical protein n=1 Tax=Corynebacterium sp. TaxID=1720 RepID=UPI0026DCA484|nr:hypothetical protein [Corynebacterium sp.]MDO5032652.1 hypothetical protein [Corynebacterium sp.]
MNSAHIVSIMLAEPYLDVQRRVAVAADTTVGELMIVIHASLGLEPASPGRITVANQTYSVLELIDERASDLFFNEFTYQPSQTRWLISVCVLSETSVPMGLPALIDATGPDLLPALGSASEMRSALEQVRNLLSGLPVPEADMKRLMQTFPNYTLEQVRVRLTTHYPPAIAARLAEMGTKPPSMPGFSEQEDSDSPSPADTDLTDLSEDLTDLPEEFFDPFADLDGFPSGPAGGFFDGPRPWRSSRIPAVPDIDEMRAEIWEAYPELHADTELPPLEESSVHSIYERLRTYLMTIGDHPTLTQVGYIKPAAVRAIVESFPLDRYKTTKSESYIEPLLALRECLRDISWVDFSRSQIWLTSRGVLAIEDPQRVVDDLLISIPFAYADDWGVPAVGFYLVDMLRGEATHHYPTAPDVRFTQQLLYALGVVKDEFGREGITPGYEGVIAELIRGLRTELNEETEEN